MKRSSLVWQVALLAVIGCSGPSETTTPADSDTAQQSVQDSVAPDSVPGEGETLVSLEVPGMHCDFCAASIREDLEKIDGVVDIKTDPEARICSFKVTDPDVDYKSELAKYAETNKELAGYKIQ